MKSTEHSTSRGKITEVTCQLEATRRVRQACPRVPTQGMPRAYSTQHSCAWVCIIKGRHDAAKVQAKTSWEEEAG